MRASTEKSAVCRSSAMVFFCAVPSATHITDETATSTRSAKPKMSTTAMVGRQRRRAGDGTGCGVAAGFPAGALARSSCVIASPAPRLLAHDLHPLAGRQRAGLGEAVQHQEVLQIVVAERHARGDLRRRVPGLHLV